MITPAYGMTAMERVLPKLALDFTTATLDSRVSFSRAGDTATVTNNAGVIVAATADTPRFDFNPVSLACNGLMVEEARANLLLNSLIDGTSLATQTVTVTAAAHTLSFYGAGQIVLSGTHSATVVGDGAYPARKTYTFTPTAGSLTLTITGTVQFANLELGAFATSFIPTDGTAKTRNADAAKMTGANFSDWYNASEGTFYASWLEGNDSGLCGVLSADDVTGDNYVDIRRHNSSSVRSLVRTGASTVATLALNNTYAANQQLALVSAYKANSFAASVNQSALATDGGGAVPVSPSQLQLGTLVGATPYQLNGWLQKVSYWPMRLTNVDIRVFSRAAGYNLMIRSILHPVL